MTNPLVCLVFLVFQLSIAQQGDLRLVKEELITTEFSLRKDEQKLDFHLKVLENSWFHRNAYTVSGWYTNSSLTDQKIALIGYYSYPQLTLYHFKNQTDSSDVLNFKTSINSYEEEASYYQNYTGYQEKFSLTKSKATHHHNEISAELSIPKVDLDFRTVNWYLCSESSSIKLNVDENWWTDLKLIASSGQKAIIKFHSPSRLDTQASCGAGSEIGFYTYNLTTHEISNEFYIESCNASIALLEETEIGHTVNYQCYDDNTGSGFQIKIFKDSADIERLD
ncbi:hypothetical protein [Psychroflexus tropicus]|uniref:hypothetical protein n=1 Tax=Psychroflexus tropicus TaxID=197345 RepID=UPI0003658BDA|nr:hypothetical protein [Psychroflexus tropicus]